MYDQGFLNIVVKFTLMFAINFAHLSLREQDID